jgi:isoleucyl-tRNA synthetase
MKPCLLLQVRPQWFVRMEPLAQPALDAVAAGDVRIVPDRFEKVYNRWLENIRVGSSAWSSTEVHQAYLDQSCQGA